MKVALLFPPQWYPSQPYLALPTLKAHLESKGHEVDQFDLNIECYDVFLSKEYLERCVEIIRRRLTDPTRSQEACVFRHHEYCLLMYLHHPF